MFSTGRGGAGRDTYAQGERRLAGDPADWSRQGDAIWLASDMAEPGKFTVSAIPNNRIWRNSPRGRLITLAAHQSAWMPMGTVVGGLPAELADARPSGFLGRHFAAVHADLRLPPRLSDWSDHHLLLAMSRQGEDLPGNLVIGEESFARWQVLEPVSRSRDDYPALAEATIAGHPPGSSAGGDRPKVRRASWQPAYARQICWPRMNRGHGRQAPLRSADPRGLALQVVASHGIPPAHTNVIETPDCWFLESERFDRLGTRGRQ
jgi:hypothetical protein